VVLVVGDVNSTVAAALAAVKLGFPVAHVEAGLRSFDREMPEEINRVLTDSISDLLFATEPSAVENLGREGMGGERVHLVGNVMVDALLGSLERIGRSRALEEHRLAPRGYAVATLHRPENVDDPACAEALIDALIEIAARLPVVFPVHPRTRERLAATGLWERLERASGMRILPPLGYLDFLRVVHEAALVLTDSGGLQEETTVLGVPCLTLRDGTERPATVTDGSNRIVGRHREGIVAAAFEVAGEARRAGRLPELWDGQAARRIVDVLLAERGRLRERYRGLRRRATRGAGLCSAA
jgi:UDP-N-acetylglucosamine 2-epimerase (non-hydrolysing)